MTMQTIESGGLEILNGDIIVVGGTISGTFVGDGGSIVGTVLSSSYASTSSFVSGAYTSQWGLTSSFATTASYALNSAGSVTSAQTASVAFSVSGSGTGSFTGSFTGSVTTASFVSGAYTSQWALTSSFATTASFALNSAGSVTSAQTASVAFTLSGSATGTLTGSITGTLLGTGSWASSASVALSASFVSASYAADWAQTAQTASFVSGAYTAQWAKVTDTASFVSGAYTAQWSLSSSWAPGAFDATISRGYTGSFTGSVTGALLGTASVANTASFVSGAYTAQWAKTADSSSFVSGAYTAQWAPITDTASFVSGAYTAKWSLSAQSAVGNAGTATALATARLINGTSFDGTANIATTSSWTTMTGIPVGIASSSNQINTGSYTGSVTGALLGTSSWAQSSSFVSGAYTAQWALSSSYATTSSFATSASYAPAGSAFDATVVRGYSGTFSGSADNATSFFGTASYALASPGGGGSWATLTGKPAGIISGGVQYGYDITGSTYISGAISSSTGFYFDDGHMRWDDVDENLLISGSILINKSVHFDTNNPAEIEVSGASTTSVNVATFKAGVASYLQINIQNLSGSTSSSSDLVATANDGNEFAGFIDVGINSNGFALANQIGGPGDAYVYTTSSAGDLYLGNSGTSSFNNVKIFAGGPDAGGNTHIFVSSSGRVGIGINGAQTGTLGGALHVDGNVTASSYTSSLTNAVGYFGTSSWAVTSSFVSGAYTAQWALSSSFVSRSYVSDWALSSSFVSRSYTAGWALSSSFAITSSNAWTASMANTASFVSESYWADWALSSSYALTSSTANQFNAVGITASVTGTSIGVFSGSIAGVSFFGTASMALTQSQIQTTNTVSASWSTGSLSSSFSVSSSYASASSTASSLVSVGLTGQVINKFAFANILLTNSSASYLSTDAVGIAGIKKIGTGTLEVYWSPAFASSNSYAVQVQAYGFTGSTTLVVAQMRRAFIPYQSQSPTTISIQCVDETATTHLTKDPWKYSIMAWGY